MTNKGVQSIAIIPILLFLGVDSGAAESGNCVLGSCKFSSESYTAEACDANSIQQKLQEDGKKSVHMAAVQACSQKVTETDKTCQASTNSSAQQAQTATNNYSNTTNSSTTSSSTQSSCADLGALMNAIKPLLQAYNQQCEQAQAQCKSTCEEQIKKSTDACSSVTDANKKAMCQQNARLIQQCNQKTENACAKYSQQSNAILQTILAAGLAMAQMLMCQQETTCTVTTNGTTSTSTSCSTTVDCSNSAYYNTPACICQANPRAAGCAAADSSVSSGTTKSDSTGNGATDNTATSLGNSLSPFTGSTKSNAGNAGGGGSGAGVNANVNKGIDAGSGPPTGKPVSSDVLAGDFGGGGGSKSSSGGGYPADNATMAQAIRNADNLKVANASGRVTGAFGRSNWQKVTERYRDNRASLLER